jgi:BirA family biotin operon repressor/biotin-[acetyl-CoA-carboxylase] ligase
MHPPEQLQKLMRALAPGAPLDAANLTALTGLPAADAGSGIDVLRALGVPIAGEHGNTWRLLWPTELLDAAVIKSHLDAGDAAPLALHWEIDSTSSELTRRWRQAPDLSVVLAETQRAGRGRRGRPWQSPPGYNIYLSCLKQFDCELGELSGLSLAAGIGVAAALAELGIAGVGLKWPNDVLVDGRKLAGILVELTGGLDAGTAAVIGIGLNVRLPDAVRADIDQPAIDLATLCGDAPPARSLIAAGLTRHLRVALDRFAAHGFAAFVDAFARRDVLRDRRLRLDGPGGSFLATGAGIDTRGALQVRRGAELVRVDSAQVTVRAQ